MRHAPLLKDIDALIFLVQPIDRYAHSTQNHRDEWLKLELDNASSPAWNRAIEIFSIRIHYRYIEPVDLLIKADENRTPIERKFGFSIMAIDCLLIETLQSFRDGLTDTKANQKNV